MKKIAGMLLFRNSGPNGACSRSINGLVWTGCLVFLCVCGMDQECYLSEYINVTIYQAVMKETPVAAMFWRCHIVLYAIVNLLHKRVMLS